MGDLPSPVRAFGRKVKILLMSLDQTELKILPGLADHGLQDDAGKQGKQGRDDAETAHDQSGVAGDQSGF